MPGRFAAEQVADFKRNGWPIWNGISGRFGAESPNVFAVSLLMPKLAFIRAVMNIQKELGVSRNLGKIFLDEQQSSLNLFEDIISHLQSIFGTSRTSIRIRLSVLNLLVMKKTKDFTSISEIFKRIY